MQQKSIEALDKAPISTIPIYDETQLTVLDYEALERLKKVSSCGILNKQKIYVAENGTEFNLVSPTFQLERKAKLNGVSQEEIDKIKNLRRLFQKMHMKRVNLQRQAFGRTVRIGNNVITNKSPLDLRRAELLELFGRMFSYKEVYEICITRFQMKGIDHNMIKAFRDKHIDEITDRINKFKVEYTDMRLAIKRGRLEELVWLYNKRKRIYELTHKSEDHKLLLSTIDAIRKEAEGDTLRIEGGINLTVDQVIDGHVQKNLVNHSSIKEIVLSRIIGKSGVSTLEYLSQLQKNWYNKVFNIEEAVIVEETFAYPSTKPYDFDQIARVNQQREQLREIARDNPEQPKLMEGNDAEIASAVKVALANKIKAKMESVKAAKQMSSKLGDIDRGQLSVDAEAAEHKLVDKRQFNHKEHKHGFKPGALKDR